MSPDSSPSPFPRAALSWTWLAYAAFIVYASLLPWRFNHRSVADAVSTWTRVMAEHRGLGSPTDWATNILLFVPLGLLTTGVLWKQSWPRRIVATFLALVLCTALTACIEFLQLFVPGRTTSYYDVKAEVIGAIIGSALWWVLGRQTVGWLARTEHVFSRTGKLERLAVSYTVLMFAYQLLPLDLAFSPAQLAAKWAYGRIVLVPFVFFERNWASTVYGVASDIALWIPVGVLAGVWRLRRGWLAIAGIAALLETMQLFVFSRVSDVNDVITAAVGGWAGISLIRWWRVHAVEDRAPSGHVLRPAWVIPWAVALVGWVLTVVAAYWYPFDFVFRYDVVRARLDDFRQVPLHAYYWSTELTAVSEILRKVMFFAPGGALLAVPYSRFQSQHARSVWIAGAAILIAGLAFGIELGQVALPEKIIDSGDPILQALGGVAGWCAAVVVLRRA